MEVIRKEYRTRVDLARELLIREPELDRMEAMNLAHALLSWDEDEGVYFYHEV